MKKIGHIVFFLSIIAAIWGAYEQFIPQKTKDDLEQKVSKIWSSIKDTAGTQKPKSEPVAQATISPVLVDSTFNINLAAGWNPLNIRPLPDEKFDLEGISDGWKWQTDCGPVVNITPRKNWDEIFCGYIRINSNIDNGPVRIFSPNGGEIKITYRKFA